jgi:hypothetical protein
MYKPPVRRDRPSSDGASGMGGVRVTLASNSTRVSSEAEKSSLKILKCLWAELRTSAVNEASRRITGRDMSNASATGFVLTCVEDTLFLKSLRDLLRTGRGIEGNALCAVVAGRVLDLESDGFCARSSDDLQSPSV